MRYDQGEYSLAAEFVKQFAAEDKSGQMAKIADMLRYAASMTLAIEFSKGLFVALDKLPGEKEENENA